MQEIFIGEAEVLTVPDGATKLTVTHEWGDVLKNAIAVSGTYSFTPDSIGVHKFEWLSSDNSLVSREFYSSVVRLISQDEFYDNHPELEGTESSFGRIERIVRGRVAKHTGQDFGPYLDKSLTVQGTGGNAISLPVRIVSISSLTNNFGDDLTDLVEIAPANDMIVQKSSTFRSGLDVDIKQDLSFSPYELLSESYNFIIEGTFGWEYVPTDVSDAADILIAEALSGGDVASMKAQGVKSAGLGDFQVTFEKGAIDGGIGNSHADDLLADYIIIGIGLA